MNWAATNGCVRKMNNEFYGSEMAILKSYKQRMHKHIKCAINSKGQREEKWFERNLRIQIETHCVINEK